MKDRLSKLTQEKTDNLNSPISNKEIELVVKSLPTEKTLGLDDSPGEFCQTFKEETIPTIHKFFQEN